MTSLTPDEGSAWAAIRISARWSTARRVIESGQQLRVAEGRLLWLLRGGRALTLREIAEELDLEQSTVNRQVHAALDSGVIRRFRREDSPTYLVEMSDEGGRRFGADLARATSIYGHAVSAVPEAERETFLEHLDAFVESLAGASARE